MGRRTAKIRRWHERRGGEKRKGLAAARRPGGQVKERRSVWFANRFGSMRSTGARPSLIRASAPLAPLMLLSSLLLAPPGLPIPSDSPPPQLHRFNPLALPVPPTFLQIHPLSSPSPSGFSLYVLRTDRKTRVSASSYTRNVRTDQLHVPGKHPRASWLPADLSRAGLTKSRGLVDLGDEPSSEGAVRIRCFRGLLRKPFLDEGGKCTERIFEDLNVIVLTQRSEEKNPRDI